MFRLSLAVLALVLLLPGASALSLQAAGAQLTVDPARAEVALDAGFARADLPLPAPLLGGLAEEALLFPAIEAAPLIRADAQAAPPAPEPARATDPVATVAGTVLLWIILEKLGAARAIGAAFAALYFRVQPNELMENARRERVVGLIRARPGIGPTEIADALGTGWGVVSYHLDRLERAGFITSQRVGHHRCYFLPGAVPRDEQRTRGMFRVETTRRIAVLVTEKPGLTQSELCGQLGLSASAASKQLSRLEAASLVRREAGNGGTRVYPAPTLATVLA